jgi:hypothetical protein
MTVIARMTDAEGTVFRCVGLVDASLTVSVHVGQVLGLLLFGSGCGGRCCS